MNKKVLITNASYGMYSPKPMQMLEDAGFEVTWIKGATRQQILENIGDMDVKAAEERGIAVKNAPGTNSDAVADFTFGLLLDAARGITAGDRALRGGGWPRIAG